MFGLSLLIGGLSQTIGQLLAAISVSRVGASPQHPVGNALLSDTFPPERRGFAISTHIAGGNVGTVLVPFVGGALLATIGWQATLAVFGIPAVVIGALIALLGSRGPRRLPGAGARVGIGSRPGRGGAAAAATCA